MSEIFIPEFLLSVENDSAASNASEHHRMVLSMVINLVLHVTVEHNGESLLHRPSVDSLGARGTSQSSVVSQSVKYKDSVSSNEVDETGAYYIE